MTRWWPGGPTPPGEQQVTAVGPFAELRRPEVSVLRAAPHTRQMNSSEDGFDARGLAGQLSKIAFSSTTLPHVISRKLAHDRYAWLTTVASSGMPMPMLVWFHYDSTALTMYTGPRSRIVTQVFEHPAASLHLESDGLGSDLVIIGGTAAVTAEGVDPRDDKAFWAKYHVEAEALGLREAIRACSARITLTPTTLWTTLPA